ncbi:MAG: SUMF1/EgtB/PvdO family nonheme iron enzyme [bacterium]
MNRNRFCFVLICSLLAIGITVRANNMSVTNIILVGSGVGYTHVACDVSWDNSWRASWQENSSMVTNWDAAWVFVKFRVATNNAPWQHATLSTNNSDHIIPAQAVFNVGTSSNAVSAKLGVGGFLYRKDEGSGNWTNTVKLRWNYAQDGVASTQKVQVSVQSIEMVYVPQGSFKVGSGGTESGSFTEGNAGTTWVSGTTPSVPLAITGEGALPIGNTAGSLWGTSTSGNNSIGSAGILPAAYPKGYNAFYCMKYEISQGQWVTFFNMLSDSGNQKKSGDLNAGRDITGGTIAAATGKGTDTETNRNTIAWAGSGDATCTTPDRACNYLGWADGAAYADWAGLRPMTELEFEKACRGTKNPKADEYAWGETTIMPSTEAGVINVTSPENGTETNKTSTALGAAVYYDRQIQVEGVNSGKGPVRCGLFATANSTRITSGATYWGIMEMTGNVYERTVTGADAGRTFTGALGDGTLDANGNANAAFWPGISASGSGYRGGAFNGVASYLRLSSRIVGSSASNWRTSADGFRAVRSVQ